MNGITTQEKLYKKNLGTLLFQIWILSLAFYQIPILGMFSLNDLLAPLLLIVAGFQSLFPRSTKSNSYSYLIYSLTISVFLLYIFGQLLSVLNIESLFWSRFWAVLKISGYFILPLLFIKEIDFLRRIYTLLVVDALIGTISVFLVSTGILQLEFSRFQPSRLGIPSLPASTGLIGNSGDLALLVTFTVLLIIGFPRESYLFGHWPKTIKSFVILCLFLGLLGSQSRNLASSVLIAVFFFYVISITMSNGKFSLSLKIPILASFAFLLIPLIYFIAPNIYSIVVTEWGDVAHANAIVRIESYKVGLRLFLDSPLIGLGPDIYRKMPQFVGQLHNLWLGSALEGGLLALLTLTMLFAIAFFGALRLIGDSTFKYDARVFAAFVISSISATSLYPAHGSHIFWLIFGISLSFTMMRRGSYSFSNSA